MRKVIWVGLLVFVAGCDEGAKTFGRTYDECRLKHAKELAVAQDACVRRFETVPVADQFPVNDGEVKLIHQTSAREELDANFRRVTIETKWDRLELAMANDTANIISRANVQVAFYREPRQDDGKFTASSHVTTLTWRLRPMIEPHSNHGDTLKLPDRLAPSPYIDASVTVTGIIDPTGRR